ncbi:MAG TPA: T9SS type A sorting domain-containing protein [Bacteroidota bacterium]|nr:T9SS type A sorting domain-containing protein [Bacteroidota bacterium]
MRQRSTWVILTLAVIGLAATSSAQVSLNALNVAQTQDFNTLVTSGSATWADNSTISGWYHARTGTGTTIVANDGASNAGNLYSYGTSTNTERALGTVGSSNAAVGNLYYGVRLVNNTGATITSLNISYIGEQWRYSGTAAAQTVTFAYQVGTGLSSLTTGTWTSVAALDFTSPIISGTTGALDGNAAANRVNITSTLAIVLTPGQEIMLRWYDPDHSGSDHGLAIDDFSVTPQGSAGPTTVAFATSSSSVGENAGLVSIPLTITNPDAANATQVTIALSGGTATNGSDIVPAYSTQVVTFPAGSGANQSISFTINDDALFEGNESAVFSITNVTGGNSASAGALNTHTVTILENDAPPTPTVILNEYFNAYGHIGTDEAVELYVVQDGLDMRGYSLADATSGGTYPFGVLTFSNDALWSNLPAGTIIVIGGMFAVPIPDTDVSDGLLLLQAPANGASNQYFTHSSNTLSIAGSSDAIAVRDAGANFIHGLAHGSSNQFTLPAGRHGWKSGTSNSVESVAFTRSGAPMSYLDFLANTYVAALPPSIGNPNDSDGNRAYLRSIRNRIVTANRSISGLFYWDITVDNNATLTLAGPLNVCNTLRVEDGRLVENAQGLSLNGNGNAQNGAGVGDLIVGDNAAPAGILELIGNPTPITGGFLASATDAEVRYVSSQTQTILPATYFNLTLANAISNPKLITGPVTVLGTLSIPTSNRLEIQDPLIVELGPTGILANAGFLRGKIRTTRFYAGGVQNFGGLGITLDAPPIVAATSIDPVINAAPGTVTVTLHSGIYRWVNNRPSILRNYLIQDSNPSAMTVTMKVDYLDSDLNGQTESGLQLFKSSDAGVNWSNRPATLNTSTNSFTLSLSDIDGLWTMHANPPQGMLTANPAALNFAAEELGPLPATQLLAIANAYGNGSIVEWVATSGTPEAPTWLSLSPVPASGVNSGNVTVQITRSNLAPGTYSGTITITDPHATNSPLLVPVTYRVYAQRRISIGVDTLRIKLTYKKPKVTTSIPVINGGESFGPGMIVWNAATATPWLRITNGAGMEGDFLGLEIDAHLFASGTYTGALTISGTNSVTGTPIVNSPLNVVVLLEVEPWDSVLRSASALPAGSITTFYNDKGHRMARIQVVSGTIQTLSIRLNPFSLPRNIQRLKYVYRHYVVEATGSYIANMTLWYSLNELVQTGITEPWNLGMWRQSPQLFSWSPIPSYANHVEQAVTGLNLGNLNGIWAMAEPYFPLIVNVKNFDAQWQSGSSSVLRWTDERDVSELGYVIERSARNSDEWRSLGIVARGEGREYSFVDAEAGSTDGWRYRLLSFDREGNALQTEPVELLPLGILSSEALKNLGYALEQNVPNPVHVAGGSTSIRFTLPTASVISLRLVDMLGREVAVLAAGAHNAGSHELRLPVGTLEAGSYLYQLVTPQGSITRRLLIVR